MKDLLDIEMINSNMALQEKCLDELPLAYSYVPYQKFETPYNMTDAFKYGTVFPKLNKPMEVYGKEFNMKAGADKLW